MDLAYASSQDDGQTAYRAHHSPSGSFLVEAVGNSVGDPTTASGFGRRGAARLSAQDLPGALTDLTEAIRKSPDIAEY